MGGRGRWEKTSRYGWHENGGVLAVCCKYSRIVDDFLFSHVPRSNRGPGNNNNGARPLFGLLSKKGYSRDPGHHLGPSVLVAVIPEPLSRGFPNADLDCAHATRLRLGLVVVFQWPDPSIMGRHNK